MSARDVLPAEIPTLAELSPRGRDICSEYYAAGITRGYEMGAEALYDAWHASAVVSAAIARSVASMPSYADLCERRGESARAARQREILLERGVVAA